MNLKRSRIAKVTALSAAAALAAIGFAAAVPASAATSAAGGTDTIKWKPCTLNIGTDFSAQCGFVSVPLNYAHPNGAKIKLAVSMVKHTSTKYQGVMLVNPGGPGGSGLNLSGLGQFVPNNAGADYDWIGFDPRGVGSSEPAVTCQTTNLDFDAYNRPNYIPTTRALTQTWLSRSRAFATACKDHTSQALLNNMTTIDAAKDMDQIRKALGQPQINYYGFSYGTYLGQVYSTLYPSHVRRMVLDSNVDPRNIWYTANLNQDVAFNANIKRYFAWLAENNADYHLGTTEAQVQNAWYGELHYLAKHPIGGEIGPDEWTDLSLDAGYYVYYWDDLAHGIYDAINNPTAPATLTELEGLYQGLGASADNGFGVYNAVQCTDIQWPTSWAKWERDNWRTYAQAPFETWDNAWYNAPCLYWPAKAQKPIKVNGSKVKSVLLVDEQYDAATPIEGTFYIRKIYPNSSMVEDLGGTTHAGTLSGDACEDDIVAAYLADGTLPARKHGNGPDTTCTPVQPPTPTPVTSSSAPTNAPAVVSPVTRAMLPAR